MRRICFAVLISAFLANATIPSAIAQDTQKQEQSCKDFVQGFYNWYLGRSAVNEKSQTAGPAWDDVAHLRPQALSPELLTLLKADLAASEANHDDIVGLDWDPFLATQDPSTNFFVASAVVNNGRCNAVVNGIAHGKKRETVMPELSSVGATWVFVNFHYKIDKTQSPADENLIATLKLLADERKKPIK